MPTANCALISTTPTTKTAKQHRHRQHNKFLIVGVSLALAVDFWVALEEVLCVELLFSFQQSHYEYRLV